jgi:hypothetical protein
MSDIYLVLRHRLDTVATEWVPIESEVLLAAMKQRGLSYEGFARQIPVSAKTAERWVKRGRVPTWHIDRVAELLGLEIERPAFESTPVKIPAKRGDELEALRSEVVELREVVAQGGQATVKALDALNKQVRALARKRDGADPPAKRVAR